jgi:AraC family transcriptional regulator
MFSSLACRGDFSAPAALAVTSLASGKLDRCRLSRVLDYIHANLEGNLSLDILASIACLSRFHFARAFGQTIGQSRLERAKVSLSHGERPLIAIALALSFSSHANFARAFRQAPGQFRSRASIATT